MKRLPSLSVLVLSAIIAMAPVVWGSVRGDLNYLGYSEELSDFAIDGLAKTQVKNSNETLDETAGENTRLSEVDAVQEQLTELGRTRSLQSQDSMQVDEIRDRLDGYWTRMVPAGEQSVPPLASNEREELKSRLYRSLENAGYLVQQLELRDMPANLGIPQVRAIIRVVRKLKSENAYREIQNNLAEVKNISLEAGMVDGIQYLSELTTFIAENPRNRYHYEKTVLNP